MKKIGFIALIIGALISAYAVLMDTTVTYMSGMDRFGKEGFNPEIKSVHNIGLMQQQQTLQIIGGLGVLVGIILIGFAASGKKDEKTSAEKNSDLHNEDGSLKGNIENRLVHHGKYDGQMNIALPNYQLYLTRIYLIEKNITLDKFTIDDQVFGSLEDALSEANSRYQEYLKEESLRIIEIADKEAAQEKIIYESAKRTREEEIERQEQIKAEQLKTAEVNKLAFQKEKPYITFGAILIITAMVVYFNMKISSHHELVTFWQGDGQILKDCAECPELVKIPSGKFEMMGQTKQMKGFLLGRTEVTKQQWHAVMGGAPRDSVKCGNDCPVEDISWGDAKEYAKKLSEKTGKRYRLPSESEWEYAARAGSTTTHHFSEDGYPLGEIRNSPQSELSKYAWHQTNSARRSHQVAQKQPNIVGLYDMYGNVWEWVEDSWHDNNLKGPKDGSAWIDKSNTDSRLARGGSWSLPPDDSNSVSRMKFANDHSVYTTGLRIVRELE